MLVVAAEHERRRREEHEVVRAEIVGLVCARQRLVGLLPSSPYVMRPATFELVSHFARNPNEQPIVVGARLASPGRPQTRRKRRSVKPEPIAPMPSPIAMRMAAVIEKPSARTSGSSRMF